MLLNTDFYTPSELTGYARSLAADLPVNRFALRQWLPSRVIDDLTYRFTRGGDSLIEAATYRAYDAESRIASRPGIVRVSGELPPISMKIMLGEYDQLRRRANPLPSVQEAILSDTDRVVRMIEARLEVARGAALADGQVTISENGFIATVDYGRSSSCQVVPTTLWSNSALATPIADLVTWATAYTNLNGEGPGAIVMSKQARGLIMASAEARGMASLGGTTPSLVTAGALSTILEANELPPITTYDVQYAVNGVSQRVIPAGYVLMLPAAAAPDSFEATQLGATFSGVTADAQEADYGLAGEEAGIVAGVYKTFDPLTFWTRGSAIALPVLVNPNLAFRAAVL